MSETTYDGAYLPSVYQNAYQYSEITTKAIVYKNSDATFGSLMGQSADDNNKVIAWNNDYGWTLTDMATASGGFNWKGSSSYDGLMYNNGSSYKNIDMDQAVGVNYAITYNADSSFAAIPLNDLATEAALETLATEGKYVVNRDASGNWTYTPIDNYIVDQTLATSSEAYVYVKDASGNNSFVRATPVNVYGQDLSGKAVYVNANSEWDGIVLPTVSGTNTQTFYHMTASTDASGTVTYSYTEVIDATSVSGFNFQSALTADQVINSGAEVAMTTEVTNFVANVNYTIDATFDIYVSDITMLADASFVGENIYAKLPLLTVKNGSGDSAVTVGTYVIKPNQPFQTVHVNKVFDDLTTAPMLYVTVDYRGVPASATDFIKYMNGSLTATATPCGSHDHSHTPEQEQPEQP